MDWTYNDKTELWESDDPIFASQGLEYYCHCERMGEWGELFDFEIDHIVITDDEGTLLSTDYDITDHNKPIFEKLDAMIRSNYDFQIIVEDAEANARYYALND